MSDYKATDCEWVNVEHSARLHSTDSCVLELRDRVMALEAQGRNYPETPDSSTPPPVAKDEELAPLLWVLWNHQGGKSDVGQTIRKYLGMGQFERMSDQHIKVAARWEQSKAQANHIGDINKMVPPQVASNQELRNVYNDCPEDGQGAALRAIYDLGVAHGQARSQEVAEPAPVAGGLVERVTLAIDRAQFDEDEHQWDEARAAILEVARWMREIKYEGAAQVLEQEAGR